MQHPSKERIDQILASLDNVQRISAPPYFYTRVRARLKQRERSEEQQILMWFRPVPVLAILFLLVWFNFWWINARFEDSAAAATQSIESEEELKALAFEDRAIEPTIAEYETSVELSHK